MIGLVAYGLGNLDAIANIYKRLNIAARPVTTASELAAVDRIILPGVGAFDRAMMRLQESGMRDVLAERVLDRHDRHAAGEYRTAARAVLLARYGARGRILFRAYAASAGERG